MSESAQAESPRRPQPGVEFGAGAAGGTTPVGSPALLPGSLAAVLPSLSLPESAVSDGKGDDAAGASSPVGSDDGHGLAGGTKRRRTDQNACGECKRSGVPMKRCLQCHDAWYCSRSCQIKAWPAHREHCREASTRLVEARVNREAHPTYQWQGDAADGGVLLTFGSAASGALGYVGAAGTDCTFVPTVAYDSVPVFAVAAGGSHVLASTAAGRLVVAGDHSRGQLGLGSSGEKKQQQKDQGSCDASVALSGFATVTSLDAVSVSAVAAGFQHSAVVTTDGRVMSFGAGDAGQLGLDSDVAPPAKGSSAVGGSRRWDLSDHAAPRLCRALASSTTGTTIVGVSCGESHTLALSADGQVFAFGEADFGALGLGVPATGSVCVPTPVAGLNGIPVAHISAGARHSLACTAAGAVYAWGFSRHGAIGVGPTSSPTQVAAVQVGGRLRGHVVVEVAAGDDFSGCVTADGSVFMWGHNHEGQLGSGDRESELSPAPVRPELLGSERVLSLSCGLSHAACVVAGGGVYAWGDNSLGQLGLDPSEVPRQLVPRLVRLALPGQAEPAAARQVSCGGAITAVVAVPAPRLADRDGAAARSQWWRAHRTRSVPPASFHYPVFASLVRQFLRDRSRYLGPLRAYLVSALGRTSALGGSFMPQVSLVESGDPVDAAYVDAPAAERFFATLLSLHAPELVRTVRGCLQRAVKELDGFTSRPGAYRDDSTPFRVLLVALQFPPLSQGSPEDIALVHDIARAVARAPGSARSRMVSWLRAGYTPALFATRLVDPVRQCLERCLRAAVQAQQPAHRESDSRPLPALQAVTSVPEAGPLMELLRLLYDSSLGASGLHADHGGGDGGGGALVPASRFYLDHVERYVDLTADYAVWSSDLQESGRLPLRRQAPPTTLCHHSFLLPAVTKRLVLSAEHWMNVLKTDRSAFFDLSSGVPELVLGQGAFLPLRVRRDGVLEDAAVQLAHLTVEELRRHLRVEFVGERSTDAGGVAREFFSLVSARLASCGLFHYNPETRCHFFGLLPEDDPVAGSMARVRAEKIDRFRLAGLLAGLAFYHGHTLDIRFSPVVFRMLLGQAPTMDDLRVLDPRLHRSLAQLLQYDGPGEVEDVFCLTHRISLETAEGGRFDLDVVPGGDSVPVTRGNREAFAALVCQAVLRGAVRRQAEAFEAGFRQVCEGLALRQLGFSASEVEEIICGVAKMDFAALEETARYEGGYRADHPTVRNFWKVVHEDLTPEQRKDLLFFCTGSDRSPVGGLGALQLLIQRAGPDSDQLPSSYTCFSTLLLPDYSGRAKLKEKLLLAIQHSRGFGLE